MGSSEDADNCSPDADTEPSLEDTQVVALTSMSEDETGHGNEEEDALAGSEALEEEEAEENVDINEEEEAEEAESASDDDVIDIEASEVRSIDQGSADNTAQVDHHPSLQATSRSSCLDKKAEEPGRGRAHLLAMNAR